MPRKHSNAKSVNRKIHSAQYKPPPARTIRGRLHTDDQEREQRPEGFNQVVMGGGYSHRWIEGAG